MKLAHLSYRVSEGVFKKLTSQAQAARNMGLDFHFFLITENNNLSSQDLKVTKFQWPRNIILKKIWINFYRYGILFRDSHLQHFDRIILRYPGAEPFFFNRFFNKYPRKIILEHHSILTDELKVLKKGILNHLRIFFEQRYFLEILSRSSGLISVTDEICRRLLNRLSNEIPSTFITNGADIQGTPHTGFHSLTDGPLILIFVSTTFYTWKGLDRLLAGLVSYKGSRPIHLLVIGDIYLEKEMKLLCRFPTNSVSISCPGKQYGEELEKSFRSAHLAVSSLALHRKKLNEACPLKTREYIARGIPFVFGYNDIDLDPVPEFALKIKEDDSPIDIEEVLSFAEKMSRIPSITHRMREFGLQRLDNAVKVQQMYDFALSTMKDQ